jgi:hypothetical protein
MTKLRDDLRTAFEREQTALGNVGDAGHQLMQNALAQRAMTGSRGLQWAAGVAAVLIAAIVIATFAIAKANNRAHAIPAATPSPKAQASPTPLGNTLDVPDSTPIIVYADPENSSQLDGVTWDGKTAGKLPNQQIVGIGNPQNNLFGGSVTIEDRTGATVMTGTFGFKGFQAMWADDGRHICEIQPFEAPVTSAPTMLVLVTVGGATRTVARVGTLYNQTAVGVAACSILSDRAVVVQSGGQGIGTAQVWAVQLSTGRVIWTYRFDPTPITVQIVASRDGMYVAADVAQAKTAGATVFGPDGSVAAHLQHWVEKFSWDSSTAVVDDGPGTPNVSLVNWRDGQVLWSSPPGYSSLLTASYQPEGQELAVWLLPAASSQTHPENPDLFVLDGTGLVVFRITRGALAIR